MLLAIDIGNSTIGMGLFGDGPDGGVKAHEIPAHPPMSRGEYARAFGEILEAWGYKDFRGTSRGVIISSVAPALTNEVLSAAKDVVGVEPVVADHRTRGIPRMDIRAPETLGVDRMAAAVAAYEVLGPPVAVVDFGTATTVNFMMRDEKGDFGVFTGGAILPGLELMIEALAARTAQLPLVKLREGTAALGKDTEENILAGVVRGTAGAVEKIIESVQEAEGRVYGVAVTGGLRKYVMPFLRRVDLEEPYLTLKGLKIIFERNERCTN